MTLVTFISHGSLEKQNQKGVCVCVCRRIYFKKLAHMIMEA